MQQKPSPLLFHWAFAPSFIWCWRPWSYMQIGLFHFDKYATVRTISTSYSYNLYRLYFNRVYCLHLVFRVWICLTLCLCNVFRRCESHCVFQCVRSWPFFPWNMCKATSFSSPLFTPLRNTSAMGLSSISLSSNRTHQKVHIIYKFCLQ